MDQCKALNCNNPSILGDDFCLSCIVPSRPFPNNRKKPEESVESSGGDNDYWLVEVTHPKRLDPYTAECEDLIEALNMTFQEGEAFKAIWRKCKTRMGDGKPGDTALRNAEKVHHFGGRMVAMEQRKLECTS